MIDGGLLDNQYENMTTMQVYNLLPDEPNSNNGQNGNGGGNSSDENNDKPFGGMGNDIKDPTKGKSSQQIQQDKNELDNILVKASMASKMAGDKPGSIPGDIQILIEELTNPKLPWNVILQNYMTSFNKDDYSYQRPNRRFTPDFYLPSLHSEGLDEIAVAVDTSGSVSEDEFRAFLTEINNIKETLNPKKTTIIDFDTSIKHVHTINEGDSIHNLPFSGRGGTDLDCVFDYYGKNKPNLLLVFSDLWCDQIEDDPGYPVIWVCVDNPNAEVNFGTLIHYDTREV